MKQIGFWDGNKQFKITNKIRLIELFAGIGSQSKALERLGIDFEHYRVCEFDRFAVQSYNAIHGTDFPVSDITQLKGADLGIVDTDRYTYIMTYSFPCQDLSKAGKQAGMSKGTRSGLLWEVERLLNETDNLPQVLLMENVPDVIGTKFMPDFAKWFEYLESRGYKNYFQVLNAKDYGIPQSRERCFMVSLLGDYYYDFPEPIPLDKRLKDVLETEVDEKYYLSDAAVEKIINAKSYNTEISKTVRSSGRASADRHSWDVVLEPSGMYAKCTPDFQRGLLPGLSRTLKATQYDAGFVLGNRGRIYIPLECWRLMGFDDADHEKAVQAGISNQRYKQAGNSIVVNVLEAIFKEMF